jgi:hypothetical protein
MEEDGRGGKEEEKKRKRRGKEEEKQKLLKDPRINIHALRSRRLHITACILIIEIELSLKRSQSIHKSKIVEKLYFPLSAENRNRDFLMI